MGNATSAQLSFEDRISFLKKTPFFIYLQDAKLLELAECVQYTLEANEGENVRLEEDTIYIVIEGELELSVLLPTPDKKNESLGYLCKKKPGDILSKISANKHATRKMSPQMKKLEIFMDDLHIIAKSKTVLVYTEAKLLHGLLAKYPELIGPLKNILNTPIEEYLANVPFLVDSHVKESKLSVLAAMCRYESYDKDETIIEENTVGTNLYIILSGSVQVLAPKRLDDATTLRRSFEWDRDESTRAVANLKEGDYFGETALFTNMPRSCSVVSLTKTLLVTVEQHVFKNFLSICPSPVGENMFHVMKERMFCKLSTLGIPFLEGIPSESLKSLTHSVSLEEIDEGNVVFKEGDSGDKFYIVVSGEVKVETSEPCDSVNNSDAHHGIKKTLGLLGPGKYFGEMALVTDSLRTATVTTKSKTLLLSVDKECFLHIFSTKQAVAEFKLRLLRGRADLKHILMHSVGVAAFRSFLEKRFAEENIDFWLAVDDYENLVEMEDLTRQSESICQKYCNEGAEKQVNIPYTIRNFIDGEINKKKRCDASLFTSAKIEIYQLMERDHFGKFKNSSEYQDIFLHLGILV